MSSNYEWVYRPIHNLTWGVAWTWVLFENFLFIHTFTYNLGEFYLFQIRYNRSLIICFSQIDSALYNYSKNNTKIWIPLLFVSSRFFRPINSEAISLLERQTNYLRTESLLEVSDWGRRLRAGICSIMRGFPVRGDTGDLIIHFLHTHILII